MENFNANYTDHNNTNTNARNGEVQEGSAAAQGGSTGGSGTAQNDGRTAQGGGSSTYGYSYVNQEQKNPNNVWRADENTSQGGYQANQGTYGQGGYQQADTGSQGGYQQADTGSRGGYQQADTGSQGGFRQAQDNSHSGQNANGYSNLYGNGGWSSYSDEKQKKKENRAKRREERRAKRAAQGGNTGFGMKVAKCAAIALVFGLVAGTAFEGSSYLMGGLLGTNEKQEAQATPKEDGETQSSSSAQTTHAIQTSSTPVTDVSAIVQECMPSIVAITNMSEVQYQNWFGQVQQYENQSAGSGIIVGEDDEYLFIATNNHVVEDATSLTIQFSDDSTAGAEIKGTDPSSDLAVVKVKKSDIEAETLSAIKVATLGDSDSLQVGSEAIAIGNALGYGQSVTTGVISALNREVTIQDETSGETFTNDLIQTDAAINPGNSGGALLNSAGEVIGINSSKYSDTTVEGMGFAIPSNTAKPIIEDLIEREVVSEDKQAFLGIKGVDVTSTIASTYNIPEGICIVEVTEGTAAEQAGLQKGDIITEFDGKKVSSMDSLTQTLSYYEAGSEVELTIERTAEGGYQEQKLSVTLGAKNS